MSSNPDVEVVRGSGAVEDLHRQLKDALGALVTSEDWRRALAVAARFHSYSFANTQLIWRQAEERGIAPTRVAGYRAWQRLDRQVRRGERGLSILAPVTRNVEAEDGEDERRVVGFRAAHVFDISQTDGEPLPEVSPVLVEGELPAEWDAVSSLIREAGFSLQVADSDRLRDANGVTNYANRSVVVCASLPGAQRFKTAVHELAHIRLHEPGSGQRPGCRGVVEVEAESVAYVVCAALEVNSSDYSLPYVAAWSGGDVGKVTATADRVIRCAHRIIGEIEEGRGLERSGTGLAQPAGSVSSRSVADGGAQSRVPGSVSRAGQALVSAVSFYERELRGLAGDAPRRYLEGRGISADSVSRWGLGYAPPAWDALVGALRDEGFSDETIIEAGLAGVSRTGRIYDRMRGRIVFPVSDAAGLTRGFAGRLLVGDGPKYLNTPETELYSKRSLLYGLDLAQPAITDGRHVVVVEGYIDAVAAHQAGLAHTVATGGTALTRQHIETLRSKVSTITLAFDADTAGALAAERVAQLPREVLAGVTVRIAKLPPGDDPAALVAGGRQALLRDLVTNSRPILWHLIDQILTSHNSEEPESFARALRHAGSLIAHLSTSSDRAEAVTYLAQRADRSERLVERVIMVHAPDSHELARSHGDRSLI